MLLAYDSGENVLGLSENVGQTLDFVEALEVVDIMVEAIHAILMDRKSG